MDELVMYFLTIGGLTAGLIVGAIIGLLAISGVLLLIDAVFDTKFGRRTVRKIINYFYNED